jgi:PPM family protein phosphatase
MQEEVVLEVVAKTNVGRIRELNEDNFIVTNNISGADWFLPQQPYANPETGTVMVIADGMGGMSAGEVASKIAIDSTRKYFNALGPTPVKPARVGAILKDAILYAHKGIVAHAGAHPETEGMGTTMVLSWMLGDKLYVGWSGDSRCYLFNPVGGLRQISKDHSYVQSLVDEGKISAAQAFDHPQNNIVLQSLGDGNIQPEPDVIMIRPEKDDLILLCSDGLSGMLTDPEIEAILREKPGDVDGTVSALIDRANAAGGTDNITVILARVLENTVSIPKEESEGAGRTVNGGGGGTSRKSGGRMSAVAVLVLIAAALAAYTLIFSHRKTPEGPTIQQNKDGSKKDNGNKEANPKAVPLDPSPQNHGGSGPKGTDSPQHKGLPSTPSPGDKKLDSTGRERHRSGDHPSTT